MIELVTLLAFVGVRFYGLRRLGGVRADEDPVPIRNRRVPDIPFSAGRDVTHPAGNQIGLIAA